MLIAGEASGDLYGAHLARALLALDPSIEVFGIGGWRMAEAGVELVYRSEDLACMGFVEVGTRFLTIRRIFQGAVTLLKERRPHLLIPIDYPGFNLRLSGMARSMGIPVLYYISPKVWAWGKWRITQIISSVSKLIVVLPFEMDVYQGYPIEVIYPGHPLVDIVHADISPEVFRRQLGMTSDRPLVGLLPGSRRQEVIRILPTMLKTVALMEREVGTLHVTVGCVADVERESYTKIVEREAIQAMMVEGKAYDLMAASDLLLVASGTATLEATILGIPMVVLYRMAPLSYALARLVVGIPFISLPNLIARRGIVPECIQGEMVPGQVGAWGLRILNDVSERRRMIDDLADVKGQLGSGGVSQRIADIATLMIHERRLYDLPV